MDQPDNYQTVDVNQTNIFCLLLSDTISVQNANTISDTYCLLFVKHFDCHEG